MSQINRLVAVSTYGSTRAEMALVNDSGRRSLTRAMRLNTTWRCRSTWLALYAMDRIGDPERAEFADRVEARLAAL
jgi:putative NADPH-quinone reductase